MRTVLLVAENFVREQRWPILVLLLWVLVMAALGLTADVRSAREDMLLIFKQLAIYGMAFAVFFGSSAIHNERKSRRILAVLAKAVGRRQYVSGLLAGIVIAVSLYCFCMGLTGSWVLGQGGFPVSLLWFMMFSFLIACLLAAAVAVLFSTFMPPLFATLTTGAVLGLPAIIMVEFGGKWGYIVPVYPLIDLFLKASFETRWRVDWGVLTLAVGETLLFWLMASWIFARRDIAVAVD
jgi:ABC-type transport system involved in multi-copper enzyme maturation permease subunit